MVDHQATHTRSPRTRPPYLARAGGSSPASSSLPRRELPPLQTSPRHISDLSDAVRFGCPAPVRRDSGLWTHPEYLAAPRGPMLLDMHETLRCSSFEQTYHRDAQPEITTTTPRKPFLPEPIHSPRLQISLEHSRKVAHSALETDEGREAIFAGLMAYDRTGLTMPEEDTDEFSTKPPPLGQRGWSTARGGLSKLITTLDATLEVSDVGKELRLAKNAISRLHQLVRDTHDIDG